jgi:thiol-disulfide isomerase/thioredoxin
LLNLQDINLKHMNKDSIKQFFSKRIVRGRGPWSIASDIVFFVLIILFLIPGTRSLIMSGVASVRTLITNPSSAKSMQGELSAESWEWNLTDEQGRVYRFSEFKGEVIFLNQWATWCPPCRAEMPSIEKLYKAFGDKVKFVMLTSEDPRTVREYLNKEGYTFPVYFGQVAGTALASRSIPSTVILNRAGGIEVNKKGAYNWNARKIRIKLSAL